MKKILGVLLYSFLLLCLFTPTAMASDAEIQEAISVCLDELMAEIEVEVENPWRKFVYSQGVSDITMDLEKFDIEKEKPLKISFKVCSGSPKTSNVEKYAKNPAEYLKAIAEQVATHDTKCTIGFLVTKAADGSIQVTPEKGAERTLKSTVKEAATKGKEKFNLGIIKTAICDYFTPSPISVPKNAPTSLMPHQSMFVEFLLRNPDIQEDGLATSTFYTMKGQKLDISGSPTALTLTFTMADMDALGDSAFVTLYSRYCYDEKAKDYSSDEIEQQIAEAMNNCAIAYRHGKQKDIKCTMTFNLLDLPKDLTYEDYLPTKEQAETLSMLNTLTIFSLRLEISGLPDYPAVDFPETGIIQGESKGTKVIIKNKNEELAYSITFKKPDTDEIVMLVFLRPSDRTTVYLPQGKYNMESEYGLVWYGAEHRFGDVTGTWVDEERINSKDYYHTFTYGE